MKTKNRMELNRREFIQALGATAAAVTLPAVASPPSRLPRGRDAAPAASRGEPGARRSYSKPYLVSFGQLTEAQKAIWSEALWKQAQEQTIFAKIAG